MDLTSSRLPTETDFTAQSSLHHLHDRVVSRQKLSFRRLYYQSVSQLSWTHHNGFRHPSYHWRKCSPIGSVGLGQDGSGNSQLPWVLISSIDIMARCFLFGFQSCWYILRVDAPPWSRPGPQHRLRWVWHLCRHAFFEIATPDSHAIRLNSFRFYFSASNR